MRMPMLTLSRAARRALAVAAFGLAGILLGGPAHALDSTPQGDRHRERHTYRDVQLGVSHPATHGKSTQTAAPPPFLFPWFLPFPPPWAPAASGASGSLPAVPAVR